MKKEVVTYLRPVLFSQDDNFLDRYRRSDVIEVYASSLSDIPPSGIGSFDDLLPFLSPEKREKIKRFLHRDDALRSLLGEWLVRAIVKKRLGFRDSEIIFDCDAYGKPFLNSCRNFHFNIAHSGCWVVCAVDENPVGIDIEKIAPIEMDVVTRVLSREELMEYMRKSGDDRSAYFYERWTLRESVVKAVGKGLSIPFDELVFMKTQEGNVIVEVENSRYYPKKYFIDKDYKMAVCGTRRFFAEHVILLEKT